MTDDEITLDHLVAADDLLDGAAMQSAEDDAVLDRLPRVLRYAVRAAAGESGTRERLAADILELAPEADPQRRAWLAKPGLAQTLELAVRLDRLSVEKDIPLLRGLADSVRIVALPIPGPDRPCAADYLRATRALTFGRDASMGLDEEMRAKVDRAVLGWAAAPLLAGHNSYAGWRPAIEIGAALVDDMTAAIGKIASASAQRRSGDRSGAPTEGAQAADDAPCPPDHVIVCRRPISTGRANDIVRPHAHILGAPVPLVPCPDLGLLQRALLAEYPFAEEAVAFCLAGLMNRRFVQFEPVLLLGAPGCGKTRFARRLCEHLNVGLWRIDSTQADGSAISGTDSRWSTASPSAPLRAISRHKHANPVLLIDEIDKAATRADYGRLWDSLIALCESENSRAHPDPALGVTVDISWVSFIATANSIAELPAPLLDRFRVVEFGSPGVKDIAILAEGFRRDLARDRRMDERFIPPLTVEERNMIARQWKGGSARRLRRMLEVVWRARERTDSKH